MPDFSMIITTFPRKKDAERIAKELVKRRLAACVQIIPANSVYRWNGSIKNDREVICMIKGRRKDFERVECAIKELHSYEVPEIISVRMDGGSRDYMAWLADSTG